MAGHKDAPLCIISRLMHQSRMISAQNKHALRFCARGNLLASRIKGQASEMICEFSPMSIQPLRKLRQLFDDCRHQDRIPQPDGTLETGKSTVEPIAGAK